MQLALENQLLTTREAAKLLGYTHDYIARMCREHEIVATRKGTQWVIDPAEAARFAQKHAARLEETRARIIEERKAERSVPVSVTYQTTLPYESARSTYPGVKRAMQEVLAVSIAVVVTGASVFVAQSGALPLLGGVAKETALTAAEGFRMLASEQRARLQAGLVAHVPVVPEYRNYTYEAASPALSLAQVRGDDVFAFPKSAVDTTFFAHIRQPAREQIVMSPGEQALLFGAAVRDNLREAPYTLLVNGAALGEQFVRASDGIMVLYERAIYALATAPEPLAIATLTSLYTIGERTQSVVGDTPSIAVTAYKEGSLFIAEAGPKVARPIVAAEIALGQALTNASHTLARTVYTSIDSTRVYVASVPGRINAYTPRDEARTLISSITKVRDSALHVAKRSENYVEHRIASSIHSVQRMRSSDVEPLLYAGVAFAGTAFEGMAASLREALLEL